MKNTLKSKRSEYGVSQEAFGAAIGVSRQTISAIENGRYEPSLQLAFRIARYFGCAIEEIFICEE